MCFVIYYVIFFTCVNFYREGYAIWRNVDVAARDLEGMSTWHHVRSGWRLPNGGIEIGQSEPRDSSKFTRKRHGFPHIRRGAPGLSTQSPSEKEVIAPRVEYALEERNNGRLSSPRFEYALEDRTHTLVVGRRTSRPNVSVTA